MVHEPCHRPDQCRVDDTLPSPDISYCFSRLSATLCRTTSPMYSTIIEYFSRSTLVNNPLPRMCERLATNRCSIGTAFIALYFIWLRLLSAFAFSESTFFPKTSGVNVSILALRTNARLIRSRSRHVPRPSYLPFGHVRWNFPFFFSAAAAVARFRCGATMVV